MMMEESYTLINGEEETEMFDIVTNNDTSHFIVKKREETTVVWVSK